MARIRLLGRSAELSEGGEEVTREGAKRKIQGVGKKMQGTNNVVNREPNYTGSGPVH